jgi:hypothetical protein
VPTRTWAVLRQDKDGEVEIRYLLECRSPARKDGLTLAQGCVLLLPQLLVTAGVVTEITE